MNGGSSAVGGVSVSAANGGGVQSGGSDGGVDGEEVSLVLEEEDESMYRDCHGDQALIGQFMYLEVSQVKSSQALVVLVLEEKR